ncbi:MAG: phosphoribosylamine--glycine ligase [Candidatus Neomarinimicrobiota bacterium]|nr:MAG: phosphoribosylamine--glycine ligase [Candidatus Neomarinimicrobiota bacterium]
MNVGIIGSGGREHAICVSLKNSKKINNVYCFPGNAGTSLIAQNIEADLNNFEELKKLIQKLNIDLIIIGPEKPLVNGLVDYLEENKIKVFGPKKIASQLEGSKIFTKKLCEKYKIPTANFGVFENVAKSLSFLKHCNFPIVVKADGLAAGKGVYICETFENSKTAVEEIFDGKFGKAKEVLIEEFLEGEEMSFFIISDGKTFKKFGSAQDHKRVLEGDKGKNTGGMGAYSPSRLENELLDKKIIEKIIEPTIKGLNDLKTNFIGFLYAGLMIIKDEPFLIEYNVRMGDPECQTILPRLKTDFLKVINSCVEKNLDSIDLEWDDRKSICIVLCSKGYPDQYENDVEIKKLNEIKLQENNYIFHAGTKIKNSKIYSNGGRVLNFVTKSKNLKESRNSLVEIINNLNWKNGYFRKDIGFRIIKK